MPRVFLGLGSNVDRERHIRAGIRCLREAFGPMRVSPVYESVAVGFVGENFLNLVVAIDTDLPLAELSRRLRGIEEANGRVRNGPKFSSRTLDIDILTYGDLVGVHDGIELPRDEVTKYAFVLRPLADIAPNDVLPGSLTTYGTLAAALPESSMADLQKLDGWQAE